MLNFTPAPGVVLIEEIKDDTGLKLDATKNRIFKGKVLKVGTDFPLEGDTWLYGAFYAKEGDVCYFMSYEGNYDWTKIDGKKYFLVKFADIRGWVR